MSEEELRQAITDVIWSIHDEDARNGDSVKVRMDKVMELIAKHKAGHRCSVETLELDPHGDASIVAEENPNNE